MDVYKTEWEISNSLNKKLINGPYRTRNASLSSIRRKASFTAAYRNGTVYGVQVSMFRM